MKRFILLTCFANAFQPKFMLAPETGGVTGGGGTGTQKPPTVPELTQKVTQLEGEKQTLTTRAETAEQKVATLETEKQTLTTRAETAEKKVKDGQRATETAAAAGVVPPVAQTTEGMQQGGDGKAHYDAYQKAMNAGEGMKAAQIWKDNQKAIEAHAATLGEGKR